MKSCYWKIAGQRAAGRGISPLKEFWGSTNTEEQSSRTLTIPSPQHRSLGAASCEHGNRYDGEGLSFFKNSSGRNSNIWIYNCLNLIDLSLKNVLLMAQSWWTGRKRRRPEDEGAPVVHVFQGEGRRRLKRTEDRHRWLYFSCGSISRCSAALSDHLIYRLPPLGTWPSASGTSIYIGIPTGADTRPEDVADTLWEAAIFRLTTLENEKDVARKR